jgi:hypothetical protein
MLKTFGTSAVLLEIKGSRDPRDVRADKLA